MADRCRMGLGQQFDAKLDLGVKCGFEKLEREPVVLHGSGNGPISQQPYEAD